MAAEPIRRADADECLGGWLPYTHSSRRRFPRLHLLAGRHATAPNRAPFVVCGASVSDPARAPAAARSSRRSGSHPARPVARRLACLKMNSGAIATPSSVTGRICCAWMRNATAIAWSWSMPNAAAVTAYGLKHADVARRRAQREAEVHREQRRDGADERNGKCAARAVRLYVAT